MCFGIALFSRRLTGADTEILHQIYVWIALGMEVHICHTGLLDDNLTKIKNMLEPHGVIYHVPRDYKSISGMNCVSYCNGVMLKEIDIIRPFCKSLSWANCMTWCFPREIEAHRRGLIDFHIYQTEHQRLKIQTNLEEVTKRPVNYAQINPYFHSDDFPFVKDRPRDKFVFGRIQRDDPGKFHPRQLWAYETMVSPVQKEGHILGFNDRIKEKILNGMNSDLYKKPVDIPKYISCYPPGSVPTQSIYEKIHCFISFSELYENLPRVGFESMSSGSVLIVDNRGGWKELIKHGETGFLCDSERDFVYYSSKMAYEPDLRDEIACNARQWLDFNWGIEKSMSEWKDFFDNKLPT